MNCLELFAGAGGAALGIEAAGLEHVGLVELNADACATLEQAGLGRIIQADVRDLDAIEAQAFEFRRVDIDLMWSSFPCQAWSMSGQRKGEDDDRNGWPWTVDAIDRFKPRTFIAENVRGLLWNDYFERVVIPDLVKRFKHVGYWVLDAADFGVPQHRHRVFVWGSDQRPTPPRRTHGPGMFTKPWVSMGEALGLSGTVDSGLKGSMRSTDRPSSTVRNGNGSGPVYHAGPWVLDHSRNTAANPTQERPTPSTEPAPAIGGKGNQYLSSPVFTFGGRDGCQYPKTASDPASAIDTKGTAYLRAPSPCVMANEVKGHTNPDVDRGRRTAVGRAADALYLATGRRRLTVQECATLQGFPPDYPFVGTKRSQYTQVGNAVPPRLAEVVVRAVLSL